MKQKEHVVSKLLHHITNEKNVLNNQAQDQTNKKHNISVSLSQSHGRSLNVSVQPDER